MTGTGTPVPCLRWKSASIRCRQWQCRQVGGVSCGQQQLRLLTSNGVHTAQEATATACASVPLCKRLLLNSQSSTCSKPSNPQTPKATCCLLAHLQNSHAVGRRGVHPPAHRRAFASQRVSRDLPAVEAQRHSRLVSLQGQHALCFLSVA